MNILFQGTLFQGTQLPFPQYLHWTSQDLADAVPLRLFELRLFDIRAFDADAISANQAPRRAWHRSYVQPSAFPAFIRIHS